MFENQNLKNQDFSLNKKYIFDFDALYIVRYLGCTSARNTSLYRMLCKKNSPAVKSLPVR